MVCGIRGNGEGILKLEFCCSTRDRPEGLGLLGEERKREGPKAAYLVFSQEWLAVNQGICLIRGGEPGENGLWVP